MIAKMQASNGKVLVRMTAGANEMYVVLTSQRIGGKGEIPVLPVYGGE